MIAALHQGRIGRANDPPQVIVQDRFLPELLWEDWPGKARDKHRVEAASPSLFGCGYEYASETVPRWFDVELCQTIRQHLPHFVEGNRADHGHRLQFGKYT